MVSDARRCDGCGESTRSFYTFHRGDEVLGTYCDRCRDLIQEHDIEPGEHEQYRLREAAC